jgi:sialate O-acetylesterase
MRIRATVVAGVLAMAVGAAGARADVKVAKVFGEGMVLQRDLPLPVWGTADAGEKVTVRFGGEEQTATAGRDGKWRVVLGKQPASELGRDFVVAGKNTVTFHDVLVGDVWVCAGQSNMEYPLDRSQMRGVSNPPAGVKDVSKETLAEVKANPDAGLRIFRVEKRLNEDLPTDGWHVAGGTAGAEAVGHFSAIGYFFGKNLRADVKVPIGLIGSYWGGSRIEVWTPASAFAGTELSKTGTATTRPGVIDGSQAGKYYDKMVAPMAGYGIKGMIWYQGESNLLEVNNKDYLEKFELFAKAWRGAWGEGDFPIGTVQIAPLYYTKRKDPIPHTTETLPQFWAIQAQAARDVTNVGMVETIDLADNLGNIHPYNKWDVGERLANWARAEVYGEKGAEWSGPVMTNLEATMTKAVITFSHGERLKGADAKPISGFEVLGADGNWSEVEAKVAGEGKLEIEGTALHGVRYGWREDFRGGLVNGAGLPAVPFKKEW